MAGVDTVEAVPVDKVGAGKAEAVREDEAEVPDAEAQADTEDTAGVGPADKVGAGKAAADTEDTALELGTALARSRQIRTIPSMTILAS